MCLTEQNGTRWTWMRSVNKLLHMFSAQSGFNIVPESIRNVRCLSKAFALFFQKGFWSFFNCRENCICCFLARQLSVWYVGCLVTCFWHVRFSKYSLFGYPRVFALYVKWPSFIEINPFAGDHTIAFQADPCRCKSWGTVAVVLPRFSNRGNRLSSEFSHTCNV